MAIKIVDDNGEETIHFFMGGDSYDTLCGLGTDADDLTPIVEYTNEKVNCVHCINIYDFVKNNCHEGEISREEMRRRNKWNLSLSRPTIILAR